MNLKALAKAWENEDGRARMWLVPYTTMRRETVMQDMRSGGIAPQEIEQWNAYQLAFYIAQSSIVDIEVSSDAGTEMRVLADFWHQRSGVIAEDWPTFQAVIGSAACTAVIDAFNSTRDRSMDAPAALQSVPGEDADPNASARMRVSSRSSGRSSAKSQTKKNVPKKQVST